jgi:hypothetical protein
VLAYRKGVDLMVVRGKWYLAIVCNVPDPEKVGLPGCSRRGSRRHQRSSHATPGELVRISIGKTNRKARQAFSSTRRRLCRCSDYPGIWGRAPNQGTSSSSAWCETPSVCCGSTRAFGVSCARPARSCATLFWRPCSRAADMRPSLAVRQKARAAKALVLRMREIA